jgi:uncharacterized membrane protein YphA (DoxX/SURF4 family)
MRTTTKTARIGLWLIQALLAALFLFAGGMKLAMPLATLAKLSPLPAEFIKFIGVCEVAGAIGLILPGLVHIREYLTPLAAAGLTIIMVGAVIITVATQSVTAAAVPFLAGTLAALVVYGRWRRSSLAA